jgi:indolepyruvate ferredoxin oxidoreductase beta subunit
MSKIVSILIAGVGGQGSIFASRVLGNTAVAQGMCLRGSETIGMAQRGGSVVSHVRISDGEIASPLIPPHSADLIIGLEPGEAVRAFPLLKNGGCMVMNDRPVYPIGNQPYDPSALCLWLSERAERLHILSGESLAGRFGARSVNVALLGACAALNALPFGIDDIEETLKHYGRAEHVNNNISALYAGAEYVKKGESR